jgi:intracellular sulfur oxidation DsrE/DsrF family protein
MKTILKTFMWLLMALAIVPQAASAADERVVYHVSDSDRGMGALRNIRNHLAESPKAQIVVVANGGGIDFLLEGEKDKNGNPYDIIVQELAAKKVQFRVCNNTLLGRKIDKSKVLPEATIVPSGVAEVARLQSQEHYAYIKP